MECVHFPQCLCIFIFRFSIFLHILPMLCNPSIFEKLQNQESYRFKGYYPELRTITFTDFTFVSSSPPVVRWQNVSHTMPIIAPQVPIVPYTKQQSLLLPWQMKSIFIIVLFLLVLPQNALFCKGFRGFVKCVYWLTSWQNRAKWSKLLWAVSSKVGSKMRDIYY